MCEMSKNDSTNRGNDDDDEMQKKTGCCPNRIGSESSALWSWIIKPSFHFELTKLIKTPTMYFCLQLMRIEFN